MTERFAHAEAPQRKPAFLFTGRYIPAKGLDVLVEAYRRYRSRVPEPWGLWCVGAGPLKPLLQASDGIEDRGFVQPEQLPALMAEASALVLPSRREPWGVVVQEAAAAGLPLLCSDACGAAVHLLQDRFNGLLFESGNAEHLARSMAELTRASRSQWNAWSENSRLLSRQFTPARWAGQFVEGLSMLQSVKE